MMLIATVGILFEADVNVANRLSPPSVDHPLGTDNLGRSVLLRVCRGSLVSLWVMLIVAFVVVAFATVLALVIVASRASTTSRPGSHLSVARELVLAFPPPLAVLSIKSAVGAGLGSFVVSVILGYLPSMFLLAYGEAIVVARSPWFEADVALGLSVRSLAFRSLGRETLSYLLPSIVRLYAEVVVLEGALRLLGLVAFDRESWGLLIYDGMLFLLAAPHILGAALVAIGFGVFVVSTNISHNVSWLGMHSSGSSSR